MSEAERRPYEQQAQRDNARYQKEKSTIPAKPKKAMSAYMHFAQENRPAFVKKAGPAGKDMLSIGKALGEAWRSVSF